MSPLPKNILKSFFEIGDRPTQQQFGILIDSSLNLVDDRYLLGLKQHNPAIQYTIGDTVLYNGLIYEAIVSSLGAFVPANWNKLNFSALNYAGTWDASANLPALTSSTGNRGDYYVVSVPGTTLLDGENDWDVRDWAVFNGVKWEKVDNSDLDIQTAAIVSYDNSISGIVATNVQGAIDEIETRLDTAETDLDSVQLNKATKQIPAVDGNFAGLNAGGDLTDTGKNPSDYLHKGNTTVFNPALQYDPATKDYVDVSISSITATDVKYTPSGDLISIHVQGAIDELEIAKQDALGYTPVPDTRTVNGLSLSADISLTKNEIGLSNVPNVNATVAANITEDTTHRFVTDTEKSDWNAKQNALGFTAVPDTRTVNGLSLSADISLTKNEIGLSNVPNVDATVAANITEDTTHRFVTDTEKSDWNAKQNAITIGTTSQYLRGDLSLATLDKTAVGLSNVPNVNATVAANITEDTTHRFVTDTEKSSWNAKQNALGFTAVPDTRTVNGLALSSNISLTKTEIGLGNVENLKVNLTATTDPAVANDATQGYAAGSRWINVTAQKEFVCTSAAAGAAVWKRTTNTVFGDDYQMVESLARTTTTSATFQDKVVLTTAAANGTYRLQWNCVVDNNTDAGEFRLFNITDNAVIGATIVHEAFQSINRTPVGGFATIVLTGSSKQISIQFRDAAPGFNSQGIQDARIEIFRVS